RLPQPRQRQFPNALDRRTPASQRSRQPLATLASGTASAFRIRTALMHIQSAAESASSAPKRFLFFA
ncbi:MAG: hypothetical protein WAN14_03035, partial [Candidatus Acidiferrales bacterium]